MLIGDKWNFELCSYVNHTVFFVKQFASISAGKLVHPRGEYILVRLLIYQWCSSDRRHKSFKWRMREWSKGRPTAKMHDLREFFLALQMNSQLNETAKRAHLKVPEGKFLEDDGSADEEAWGEGQDETHEGVQRYKSKPLLLLHQRRVQPLALITRVIHGVSSSHFLPLGLFRQSWGTSCKIEV